MSKTNQFSGSERGGAMNTERSGSSSQENSGSADSQPSGQGRATAELANKAGEVRQNLQEMGSLARGAAQETVEQLRETATDYYNTSRDRAYELEQSIESRIREKPLNAVLIAAGVGILAGIMLMRR